MARIDGDDVVQQVAPTAFSPPLRNPILPRTPERSSNRPDCQRANRDWNLQPILGVPIKDGEPRSRSKCKCFSHLLDDPQACRMLCDIEVHDAPAIVTDNENAIEQAERDRRNREDVHRGNRFR